MLSFALSHIAWLAEAREAPEAKVTLLLGTLVFSWP